MGSAKAAIKTGRSRRRRYLLSGLLALVLALSLLPVHPGAGANAKLRGALAEGASSVGCARSSASENPPEVRDFQISPDSSRVVYRADQDTDGVSELYSVPLAGGAATKLSGEWPGSGEDDEPAPTPTPTPVPGGDDEPAPTPTATPVLSVRSFLPVGLNNQGAGW